MCGSAGELTAGTTALLGPLGGLAVAGPLMEGDAIKAQKDFQAQISLNNSLIAGRNAEDARVRGVISAEERGVKTRQDIGKQRVSLAANGVLVDSGSALELTSDTAAIGKLDSLRIINNAEREAVGFETTASNFKSEASAHTAAGKNAKAASRIKALNSLVDFGFKAASVIA